MKELRLHRDTLSTSNRPLAADVAVDAFGEYRGYAALVERWCELASAGARVVPIGHSVQGTPLFAVEIGAPRATLASVLLAGIHPIEWIGVEVGLSILERLVRRPPTDRRVIAFPLVNVDGYRQVEADLRRRRRRFRRSNANGVDLNRNWLTHFRSGGKRALLQGWNQGGSHPLSEPEIAAVVAHCDQLTESGRIDAALSLHSIGRMILYPFGGRWAPPGDAQRERRAAEAVRRNLPERYTVRQSARWVPGLFAHGMELDHLRSRYDATSLLVECSLGGIALRRPGSLLHPFRWFNPSQPGRVAAGLAAALEPFVRGELTRAGGNDR